MINIAQSSIAKWYLRKKVPWNWAAKNKVSFSLRLIIILLGKLQSWSSHLRFVDITWKGKKKKRGGGETKWREFTPNSRLTVKMFLGEFLDHITCIHADVQMRTFHVIFMKSVWHKQITSGASDGYRVCGKEACRLLTWNMLFKEMKWKGFISSPIMLWKANFTHCHISECVLKPDTVITLNIWKTLHLNLYKHLS